MYSRLAPRRLVAAVRTALDGAAMTFCKVARIQFDAPWRSDRRRAC